jgi:hypothetical protein
MIRRAFNRREAAANHTPSSFADNEEEVGSSGECWLGSKVKVRTPFEGIIVNRTLSADFLYKSFTLSSYQISKSFACTNVYLDL